MLATMKRPYLRCLALALVSCLIVSTGASEAEKKVGLTGKQESLLRDQVVDLKRLSSLQSGEAIQEEDQVALANHDSIVLDDTSALLPQILMMTSGSAPLPHGRRRLDDSTNLMTLPTSKRERKMIARKSQSRVQPDPEAGLFDKIVDDGSSQQLDGNSIPHKALMAMMANNNFNRMALASARRLQRAQAEQQQMNARAHSQQGAQINRRSLRPAAPVRTQPKAAHMNRPQESKVNNKRMRGQTSDDESLNEFNDNDERDEIRSRSGSSDYDDGDESDELDDASPNSRERSTRRQASDDIFNELDDDKSSADEGASGDEDSPAPRTKSASEQQRLALKKAATRGRAAGMRPKQMNRAQDQQDVDVDEDIDSTNARQHTIQRDAHGGSQPIQKQRHAANQNTPQAIATDVYDEMRVQRQNNNHQQLIGSKPDNDDLSAASHVRNTATDLQAAAGKHYGGHHYHQMVEVPKKKAYKMSFKRGNHKHEISKKEKLHKHKFHTKFMWHAKEKCKKKKKCKSVGKMTWEYKHDKKHHHH